MLEFKALCVRHSVHRTQVVVSLLSLWLHSREHVAKNANVSSSTMQHDPKQVDTAW